MQVNIYLGSVFFSCLDGPQDTSTVFCLCENQPYSQATANPLHGSWIPKQKQTKFMPVESATSKSTESEDMRPAAGDCEFSAHPSGTLLFLQRNKNGLSYLQYITLQDGTSCSLQKGYKRQGTKSRISVPLSPILTTKI